MHGLVKTIWKLLQIQAIQLGQDGDEAVWNLYGIRLVSHLFYLDIIITFCLISRKKHRLSVDTDFQCVSFFTVQVIKHWHRLPAEVAQSLSLEISKPDFM